MDIIRNNTPVEEYWVRDRIIGVKREDMSCPAPGPSFSKIRGVYKYVRHEMSRSVAGIDCVAAVDTLHSKAGWGTAYLCDKIGVPCCIYYPHFKREEEGFIREYQQKAAELGAEIIPLQATKSAVLFYQARRLFKEKYPFGLMLPNGLKLSESVEGTYDEALQCSSKYSDNTAWIVSVSSGTIGAGLLRFIADKSSRGVKLYIHMGYHRSMAELSRYMVRMAKIKAFPDNAIIIDERYEYADKVEFLVDFPCNEYYDLKAWKWLNENMELFRDYERILFWNIGE